MSSPELAARLAQGLSGIRQYAGRTANRFAATSGQITGLRVMLACAIIYNTFSSRIPGTADFPPEIRMQQGFGLMDFFYQSDWFQSVCSSPSLLTCFSYLTIALALCVLLGRALVVTIPLTAVSYFVFKGINHSYLGFFHIGHLSPLLLLALLFVQDRASRGRFLSANEGEDELRDSRSMAGAPAHSLFIVKFYLASVYACAGFSKLVINGLDWPWVTKSVLFSSSTIHHQWLFPILDALPGWLFYGFGMFSIVTEIFYGLVLFSRKAAFLFPLFFLVFHVALAALNGWIFIDFVLINAFLLWQFIAARKMTPRSGAPLLLGAMPTRSVVFILLVVASSTWLVGSKSDYYPLTSWNMFAGRQATQGARAQMHWFTVYEGGEVEERSPDCKHGLMLTDGYLERRIFKNKKLRMWDPAPPVWTLDLLAHCARVMEEKADPGAPRIVAFRRVKQSYATDSLSALRPIGPPVTRTFNVRETRER